MKQGIWKKYAKTKLKEYGDKATYDELYEDLKNSGKDWSIANDYGECVEELSGEFLSYTGRPAGDIYVYYINDNGNLVPELYMKIVEHEDLETKEKKNYIEFNSNSLGIQGEISNKCLPIVIDKLREIDETKNKHYIETFEKKYINYQKLLSLKQKDTFNEDELLFLYDMAYSIREGHLSTTIPEISIPIVQKRNIQQDFESFSIENKVKLFLSIKGSKMCDKLKISDKDVLMLIAKTGCISQLRNATEDIINDKNYIVKLLSTFFKTNELIYCEDMLYISKSIPLKYQSDIDILELMLYEYPMLSNRIIYDWSCTNPELKEKIRIPLFAYRLIDSSARSIIKLGKPFYKTYILYALPEEILNDIENHILIGPEPTEEQERIKRTIIDTITKEKTYIYRHKNNQ